MMIYNLINKNETNIGKSYIHKFIKAMNGCEKMMILRFSLFQLLIFIITLPLCRSAVKLMQKYLFNTKYKLTQSFSYFLVSAGMLVLGLIIGDKLVYSLL